MTYGSLASVHYRLQIPQANTGSDAEITDILTDVDAIINTRLAPYTALPLPTTSPYSTELAIIANDLAAGIFRMRRMAPGDEAPQAMLELAETRLQAFLTAHFRQTLRGVGSADMYSDSDDNPRTDTGLWQRRFPEQPVTPVGDYSLETFNQGTFLIRTWTPREVLPGQTLRFHGRFIHTDDGLIAPTGLALAFFDINDAAVTGITQAALQTPSLGYYYVDVTFPSTAIVQKVYAKWSGTYADKKGTGTFDILVNTWFKVVGKIW